MLLTLVVRHTGPVMGASRLPETAPISSCPQCHTPVRAGDIVGHACGINLALVAVLAEGDTRASLPRSEPGQGNRFSFELPIARAAALPTGLARAAQAA